MGRTLLLLLSWEKSLPQKGLSKDGKSEVWPFTTSLSCFSHVQDNVNLKSDGFQSRFQDLLVSQSLHHVKEHVFCVLYAQRLPIKVGKGNWLSLHKVSQDV